jgi:thioredoxin reductase (NADPH)
MPRDEGRVELTVYSRAYCHLCDEMIAGLRTLQARFDFGLDIVDVDSDDALETLYGEDVPVVVHGATELCRHRLDPSRVTEYLSKIG